MCPLCRNPQARTKKKGFFPKHTTRAGRIQRYHCHDCRRSFSDQTGRLTYREKKPHENQRLYRLLCCGVSQARAAAVLGIHRVTVARKLEKLARFARQESRGDRLVTDYQSQVLFDEMETFEHSKCKPLSIVIVVDAGRRLLALETATMPAKGRLAGISRRRYGPRPDLRRFALRRCMERLRTAALATQLIKTDKKSAYRRYVRAYFPDAAHITSKGRRGCVVGQGELKAGGFDPLFTLNHTCAMVRDNLKTLSRRTWCTVKRVDRLQDLLDLYLHFHNRFVVQKQRVPTICGDPFM